MACSDEKLSIQILKNQIPILFSIYFSRMLRSRFRLNDLSLYVQLEIKTILSSYFTEKTDEYWVRLFEWVVKSGEQSVEHVAKKLSHRIWKHLNMDCLDKEKVIILLSSKEFFKECCKDPEWLVRYEHKKLNSYKLYSREEEWKREKRRRYNETYSDKRQYIDKIRRKKEKRRQKKIREEENAKRAIDLAYEKLNREKNLPILKNFSQALINDG